MKLVKNPNSYSCLACCYAMMLSLQLKEVISLVGHDGSAVIYPRQPEPAKYRGFVESELVHVALAVHRYPVIVRRKTGITPPLGERAMALDMEDKFHALIIEGGQRILKIAGHAVVQCDDTIYDPKGRIVSFSHWLRGKHITEITLFG